MLIIKSQQLLYSHKTTHIVVIEIDSSTRNFKIYSYSLVNTRLYYILYETISHIAVSFSKSYDFEERIAAFRLIINLGREVAVYLICYFGSNNLPLLCPQTQSLFIRAHSRWMRIRLFTANCGSLKRAALIAIIQFQSSWGSGNSMTTYPMSRCK